MPLSERVRLRAVPKRGTCSTAPAGSAANAMVTGDGHMYLEVFGNPFAEQIVFHQERLRAPWKGKPLQAPDIASALPEVRTLILAGEYKKADELSLAAAEKTDTKPSTAPLREHPAFTMRIDMPDRHAVWDYLRTTDFESGEVKVQWKDKAGEWERRTFVSRPDNVAVQKLSAPSGSSIEAKIQLDTSAVMGFPGLGSGAAVHRLSSRIADDFGSPPLNLKNPGATEIHFERQFNPTDLVLLARYVVDEGTPGYASVTRVVADGGTVAVAGDSLVVHGARSLILITRIEPYKEITQEEVDALKAAVDEVTTDYDQLLARHRPGQAAVMDRLTMDFGGGSLHSMSGEEMITDQRTHFGYNPALLEDMFDMGRYWVYARTGEFPPRWAEFNININLQLSGMVEENLPETLLAYAKWIDKLLPDARQNAKNIYGARGALYPLIPGLDDAPSTHFLFPWPHEYWISASGWIYSPMWDYYLATGDKQFLRDYVMPGLEEIALFYEDYLSEKDSNGNFIFVPSYSPENWPSNSQNAPMVINATMDISVCREVLTHLIEASQTLGLDTENIPHWKEILAKLPPYLTDPDGALKEWSWPTLDDNLDHRHLSLLYGAWPGDEFSPDQDPALARAALLASRRRAQGNASAHGLMHRALIAARLKDAYLVNFDLKQILEQGYVNPAFTTNHNPYAFPAPDPQGSLPTLMMEMLIYSRPGVIELLPASPDSIARGSAKGVVSRTQATIDDLTWNLNAHTVDVTISSHVNQTVKIVIRKGIESASAPEGVLTRPVTPGSDECSVRLFDSQPVTLHFTIGDQDQLAWVSKVAQ